MKKLILLALAAALGLSLNAIVDFTLTDSWDLGRRITGTSIPLGGNRFAATTLHSLDVYEASSTSLQRVQSLFSTDIISGDYNHCIDGDRLYIITRYRGVLVYQIQPNHSLSFLARIDPHTGLGEFDGCSSVWACGNILLTGVIAVNSDGTNYVGMYYDLFDISDLNSPQFIARHLFHNLSCTINVHPVADGYYLVQNTDFVYFTQNLADPPEMNMLQDASPNRGIMNSFWYMGKLHLLKMSENGVLLQRYSETVDHHLSPDWTINLPQIEGSYYYHAEPGRVCIIGWDQQNNYKLISYTPSAGTWTLEYIRDWTGQGIFPLADGYLGSGAGKADYYDQQLNLVSNVADDHYDRAIGLIARRWVMFRRMMPGIVAPLSFYDLQNRQWLDVQALKTDVISSYRQDADYLCLPDENIAQLLRFMPDGSCQGSSFIMPHFCYGMDVWGNRMAITHVINNQFVLKLYDISSGTPVELASQVLGDQITRDMLFYGPDHLVISKDLFGDPRLLFFRIEPQGTITAIANLQVVDYDNLTVLGTKILTGRAEAAVIDISDPNQPQVSMYTDPMLAFSWGGYISRGENNYLFSDSVFWLSYITDSQLRVLDHYFSEYSWYLSPNHILLQSYSHLLEVEHQAYTDNQDPSVPELVNLMELPYPNPFRQSVKVDFELPGQGPLQVGVYNVKGQKVRSLENRAGEKGKHTFSWDGLDDGAQKVSCGVYIFRLSYRQHQYIRKTILMRD